MKTDRELLELAAKAAWIEVEWVESNSWGGEFGRVVVDDGQESLLYWNPLTDDGDALRLAVKLKIEIAPEVFGLARTDVRTKNSGWLFEMCKDNEDIYTTTRRAIVRAAAQIGETL